MKPLKLVEYLFCSSILLICFNALSGQQIDSISVERKRIMVTSSIDGSSQPSYLYLPPAIQLGEKIPLVVLLHTWSNDLEQRFKQVEQQAASRGWLLLAPNFRGGNDHPEACGSALAQQDIMDAVSWAKNHYTIDKNSVFLIGFSGGAYLTMLMAAVHPKQWAAASAWCGISDLTQWYELHQNDQYGQMMRQCFGGHTGGSDSIARQYRNRSPITFLSKPTRVPLDIAAGRYDSTVPPSHAINAFNTLVKASGYPAISKEEIDKAFALGSMDSQSRKGAIMIDSVLGRRIFLRRQEGKYRITIFDGEHEWVPDVAMQWFDMHYKKGNRKFGGIH